VRGWQELHEVGERHRGGTAPPRSAAPTQLARGTASAPPRCGAALRSPGGTCLRQRAQRRKGPGSPSSSAGRSRVVAQRRDDRAAPPVPSRARPRRRANVTGPPGEISRSRRFTDPPGQILVGELVELPRSKLRDLRTPWPAGQRLRLSRRADIRCALRSYSRSRACRGVACAPRRAVGKEPGQPECSCRG
jgi:hypothetical protein